MIMGAQPSESSSSQPELPLLEPEDIPGQDPNRIGSNFPVFEWEEDAKTTLETVYTHSEATLEGEEEGILVDTGSRGNLTGLDFITRQTNQSQKRGLTTQWVNLEKPKTMGGVGKGVENMLSTGHLSRHNPRRITCYLHCAGFRGKRHCSASAIWA